MIYPIQVLLFHVSCSSVPKIFQYSVYEACEHVWPVKNWNQLQLIVSVSLPPLGLQQEPLRAAVQLWGLLELEVIIWRRGVFGKVLQHRRAMSTRHLDFIVHPNLTRSQKTDVTDPHTSHFTPRLFVTGKSQHALWMCSIHLMSVCVVITHRWMCMRGHRLHI